MSLKKQIGLLVATSIVIGIVIGSGVFVKPGKVLAQTGSSNMALMAWLVGGLLTILAGLTIAEVSARLPRTGGVYAYLDDLYGPKVGFLCGWVLTFIYGPGLKGALSLYFASLAQPILGFNESLIVSFAIGSLLLLTILNVVSTKASGIFTTLTTGIKLLPILILATLGLTKGVENPFGALASVDPVTLSFGAAVLSTLWAYDGWMLVGNMAGEMKHPTRDLPRAIILGLTVVIVSYLVVNYALFKTLPLEQIASLGANASSAAAESLLGPFGATLISVGIMISIYGCLNGDVLSSPRVPYAIAAKRTLNKIDFLHKVHPKFGTPVNAILLQVVVAVVMIMVAKPDQITDFAMFSVYIFYTLAIAGVFILRRRPQISEGVDASKVYKTPLYPVVPILAIVGSVYILAATVLDQPQMAAISLLITAAGYPVYLLLRKKA